MAATISQDIIEFYILSKIETGEVNGRIKKCYVKKSARKKLIQI